MANEFGYFLEDYPESTYQGLLGTKGSSSFLDYWRKQYGNVFGKYQGQLGSMAIGGQAPNLSFYDYLMQQPSFQQQWSGLAPWTRGQRPTPSMRWMIPR